MSVSELMVFSIFFGLWIRACAVSMRMCVLRCLHTSVHVYGVKGVRLRVPEADRQWWDLGSFRKMSRRKNQKIPLVCRLWRLVYKRKWLFYVFSKFLNQSSFRTTINLSAHLNPVIFHCMSCFCVVDHAILIQWQKEFLFKGSETDFFFLN